MANIVMNPALVIQGTPSSVVADKLVSAGPKGSFSDHLERKMAEANREASNKLGMSKSAAAEAAQVVKDARHRSGQKAKEDDEQATVMELLQQVMRDLQAQAKDIKQGPGEWSFSAVETPALSELAAKAGMNETEIAWLRQQANEQGGKVKVADFFAALEQYFARLAKAEPITVPETDLPLIETFLSKMGLPIEESNRIAKAAVPGGGNLDLGLLLKSLQETSPATVEGLAAIPLTPWEGEQLQLMLAKAGLPRSYQESLLATASLNLAAAGRSAATSEGALLSAAQHGPTELNFSSLTAMVESRLRELKGSRTVADLPGFLGELKEVLTQAGFADKTVGWAPVVQNSAQAIYDELQQLVEATKKAAAGSGKMGAWAGAAASTQAGLVGEERRILAALPVASADAGRLAERLTDQLQALKVKQALAEQQRLGSGAPPPSPPAVAVESTVVLGQVAQELQDGTQEEQAAAGLKLQTEPDGILSASVEKRATDLFLVQANPSLSMVGEENQVSSELSAPGGKSGAVLSPFQVPSRHGEGGEGKPTSSEPPVAVETSVTAPPPVAAKAGGKSGGEGAPGSWGEQGEPSAAEKGKFDSADFAQSGHDPGGEGKGLPASAMAVGTAQPPPVEASSQGLNAQTAVRQVSEFERLVMNQISDGVARGLKNDDHHLLLTLNPKDLGEVKVDMKVRDHQVAVSFVMENSKVKEALESQLSDFKDNLQKQGYSLGEYSVTVNRDDGGHDARQRFEFAWQEQMRGSKIRPPVPSEEGAYWSARPAASPSRPGAVNLVI